jgi:hypothetical protein
VREWNPGCAASRADVDDRPVEPRDELNAAQRIVKQRAARGALVADRRQSRRRNDCGEPVLKRA